MENKRKDWLALRERERESGLSLLDISNARLSYLSLSKTVFLSLDMYLVYRHYGKPLYAYTYFCLYLRLVLLSGSSILERRQHHESLRPWKQVSFSLL
jgi:hypothetical protein